MESQNTKQNRATWRLKSFAGGLCLLVILLGPGLALAQTSSFTYQGRFTDGGTTANGTYDMQFKLFDTATVGAGSQIGSTITNGAVLVSNGVFTVQLDYGAAAFTGPDRYLEIGVRLAGDANPYTILSPRQQLTSAVYAIRAGSAITADTATTATSATSATTATNATNATNASQLGGIAAGQYVQTSDSRLSDSRPPTPGSASYIQNSAAVQAASNFNISGNGTAGGTLSAKIVNTTTNYSIGGNPVLRVTGSAGAQNTNIFAGVGAGASNTAVGSQGIYNTFFGTSAGTANTTGKENAFFGTYSGLANTIGSNNAYFGVVAGANSTGSGNSFFGSQSGSSTTSGQLNTFVGSDAGHDNKVGSGVTLIGASADVILPDLENATAIGFNARVSQSNSLILGSIQGVNFANYDTSVGIGTTAPNARFHIATGGGNIVMGPAGCSSIYAGIGFGTSLSNCNNYSMLGNGTDTLINRSTGGGLYFRENNVNQMVIASGGVVSINTLSPGGSISLCRTATNQIANCGSSLRYKTNIQPFISGLSVLNRLRPITFDWKQGGMHDLGFGAEEIAAVEPLLVTHNDKGQVEGVKYDRITAVLVNAVKEQQAQIKQQQNQIESLKKLVCQRNRRAAVCK